MPIPPHVLKALREHPLGVIALVQYEILSQQGRAPGETPRVAMPSDDALKTSVEVKDGEFHVTMGVAAAAFFYMFMGLSVELHSQLAHVAAPDTSPRERAFYGQLIRFLMSPGDSLLSGEEAAIEGVVHAEHYTKLTQALLESLQRLGLAIGPLLEQHGGDHSGWYKLRDAIKEAKSGAPLA